MNPHRKSLKELFIRNRIRFLLLLSLFLILAGGGIGVIGYAVGGFHPNIFYADYGEAPATIKTDSFDPSIREIRIDLASDNILIRQSDSHSVNAVYNDSFFACEDDGEELRISARRHQETISFWQRWYRVVNFNTQPNHDGLLIEIPEKFSGTLRVNSDHGHLIIDNLDTKADIALKSNSGNIELYDVTAQGDPSIQMRHGNLSIQQSYFAQSLDINNESGSLTLESVESKQLRITGDHINCQLAQVTGDSLEIKTESTNTDLSNVIMQDRIHFRSNHGNLLAEGIFSPNMALFAKSGNLYVNIAGSKFDYDHIYKIDDWRLEEDRHLSGGKVFIYGSDHGTAEIDFDK